MPQSRSSKRKAKRSSKTSGRKTSSPKSTFSSVSISQGELDKLFGGKMNSTSNKTENIKKVKPEDAKTSKPKASEEDEAKAKARAAKIAERKARSAALLAEANATSPRRITVVYGSILKKQKDVDSYAKGSIIELDREPVKPANILVDGKLFARGKLSSQNGHASVQITEIVKQKT